ncbi:MAG: MFS transporter [Ruminococcus sp.]|nr:MFS transporter [Ruminococcus sp.]
MAMKIFKNAAALHYFKTDLKKNLKFFIICLALHMFSFPLMFITMTYDATKRPEEYLGISDFFVAIAFLFAGLAILAGVLIAINNFSYLHKKHESDTYMSLPLSDKQRFFTDYFSGLATYIVPLIISGVFTFITAGIFIATVTGDNAKSDIFGYEPIIYNDHTIHWFEILFIAYFLVIIAMIMFYTITVLACTLCGSIFEAIVHVIILNGAIPGMIMLVTFIMFNKVPTMSWYSVMLPILSKTSPIGAAVSYVLYMGLIDYDTLLLPFLFKFSAWLIVFTVLYVIGSFLLYKFRKAEDVAKPYVFKSYYYIIMTCITFAICSAIPVYWEIMLAPMLVVAVVFYLIFEVITNRGFKKFGYSAIRCAATIAISFVLIIILNNPWGFGLGKIVPKASSVKSVSITYRGIHSTYYDSITFTDKDAIKIITEYHKDAVEDAYKDNDYGNFMGYDDNYYDSAHTVTYKLKNGTTFTRELDCDTEQLLALAEIETFDEYAKGMANRFYEEIKIENQFLFITPFETYGYGNEKSTGFFYGDVDVEFIASDEKFNSFAKDLKKAIERDFSERTYNQIIKPYSYCGYLSINGKSQYVYEYDEHILSVLKKYGIYTTTPKKYLEENYFDTNPFNKMYINYTNNMSSYSYELYKKQEKSYRYFNKTPSTPREHELMLELATVLVPFNFESENPYVLGHFFVPEQYEHLADELYSLGSEIPYEEWIDTEVEYGDEYYEDYYDEYEYYE